MGDPARNVASADPLHLRSPENWRDRAVPLAASPGRSDRTWVAIPSLLGECRVTNQESVTEAFVGQVEDALKHIYDLPYLDRHPLARELAADASAGTPGQQLRRLLVAGIDALSPGTGVPFRALHARDHSVLTLRYMEQMTVQETANQLAISPRQAIRSLRKAERGVAAVLWAKRSKPAEADDAERLSSLQVEIGRLPAASRPTDVCELVRGAEDALRPLMAQRGVTLDVRLSEASVTLPTNPVLAQQALVSFMSHAVGQVTRRCIELVLEAGQEPMTLALTYIPEPPGAEGARESASAAQLAERLGWEVHQEDLEDGHRRLVCSIPARRPTVLIIDDNESLVELLQRFLADQACRVLPALNGQEGIRLAHEAKPNAIVLDVMMPGVQGWEVLQRLHNDPVTSHIPIIVCSVINEPALARALGAVLLVPKPIRQVDVLEALKRVGVVP